MIIRHIGCYIRTNFFLWLEQSGKNVDSLSISNAEISWSSSNGIDETEAVAADDILPNIQSLVHHGLGSKAFDRVVLYDIGYGTFE